MRSIGHRLLLRRVRDRTSSDHRRAEARAVRGTPWDSREPAPSCANASLIRVARAGTATVLQVSSPQDRLVAQLARIKELSGLSLRALARQAGLSSSSLSRYLTGQLVPPWEAVVALCRVVGRDPRPLRAVWAEAAKAGAGARPAPQRPAGRPVRLHRPGGGVRAGRGSCCAPRTRSRSTAWRAWARPASPCTWPTGSPRPFRTAGSTSTCAASPRARSRWSRRPRWAGCSRALDVTHPPAGPPNARRSGARSCPAGGRSSCSTTRSTRSRYARSFPAPGSPRSWSPAAIGWSAWTGCRRCPWSRWPTTTRPTCSAGPPGSRSGRRRSGRSGAAAVRRAPAGAADGGRAASPPSRLDGRGARGAAARHRRPLRRRVRHVAAPARRRSNAACSGCWACCRAPTSTRRWRARSPTCRRLGSTRCWRSWSTPTCSRSSRPAGTGCTT